MSELLVHRRLRVGALRAEEGDFEWFLLRQAGGHDLAEQPRDLLVAQRAVVTLQRRAQNLRFAFRAVKVHSVTILMLGNANLPGQQRPPVDQFLQLDIERVDLVANARERFPALLLLRRRRALLGSSWPPSSSLISGNSQCIERSAGSH